MTRYYGHARGTAASDPAHTSEHEPAEDMVHRLLDPGR